MYIILNCAQGSRLPIVHASIVLSYVIMNNDSINTAVKIKRYGSQAKSDRVGRRRVILLHRSVHALQTVQLITVTTTAVRHAYQLSAISVDNNNLCFRFNNNNYIVRKRRLTKKFPKFFSTLAHTLTCLTILCFLFLRAGRSTFTPILRLARFDGFSHFSSRARYFDHCEIAFARRRWPLSST